ncbi:MAG: acetylglutamate kinase [Gammaproteobacteria bacterium]
MSIKRKQAENIASVLVEGMPYIQRFSGKKIVIKYGGAAMSEENLKKGFARDIALMKLVGMLPIVIHGGGPQIGHELKKKKIETKFINGYRVTDEKTMKVVKKILGREINKEIVDLIDSFGGKAKTLSWFNSNLLKASKLIHEEDLGLVGKVDSVRTSDINKVLRKEYIPIISPIGKDKSGNCLNINADLVAGKIASTIKAEKLILLTDVSGVQDKKGSVLSKISTYEAKKLLKTDTIKGGMSPKLSSSLESINEGTKSAHIIDGRVPHAVLLEVLTDDGVGTLIS